MQHEDLDQSIGTKSGHFLSGGSPARSRPRSIRRYRPGLAGRYGDMEAIVGISGSSDTECRGGSTSGISVDAAAKSRNLDYLRSFHPTSLGTTTRGQTFPGFFLYHPGSAVRTWPDFLAVAHYRSIDAPNHVLFDAAADPVRFGLPLLCHLHPIHGRYQRFTTLGYIRWNGRNHTPFWSPIFGCHGARVQLCRGRNISLYSHDAGRRQ